MARRNSILLFLFIGTLMAILAWGLDPKGYDFSNHVSRTAGGPGIRFEKYGIAYARLGDGLAGRLCAADAFSILMVFQSKQLDNNGSGHILTLHAGDDKNQLVIWQWFSHIIAMNDNDYAHHRKTGRVSAQIPTAPAEEVFLALTTGPDGTALYFDGQPVSSSRSLHLEFPACEKTTLVLGNSVYGDGSWRGSISGLALFDRDLRPESVASLYKAWAGKRSFAEVDRENPSVLYLFDEEKGALMRDRRNGAEPLVIPSGVTPLKKRFLEMSLGESGLTGSLIRDALLNLAGFVPLGFFFAAILLQRGGTAGKRSTVNTVLFCFAISLTIEVLQAWIPSRSSQFLDLILNTAGGYAGAALLKKHYGRLRSFIGG